MSNLERKNARVALLVFGVVAGMIVLSFASVPLYNLFCRVTGFGGTTQIASEIPTYTHERKIVVKFDSSVSPGMPWVFKPNERQIEVNLGQKGLTSYMAKNRANEAVMGTALYNVVPNKAGQYFHKVECFCFGEQVLQAGEEAQMPVLFYISPDLADDPQMDDVNVITLSYTFFKKDTDALEQALEDFYNQDGIKTN